MLLYFVVSVSLLGALPIQCTSHSDCGIQCESNGTYYLPGQQVQFPGYCVGAYCQDDGTISQLACGLVGVPEGNVGTTEDKTKPYPECCAKVVPKDEVCYVGQKIYKKGDSFAMVGVCGLYTCKGNNTVTILKECPRYDLSDNWVISAVDLRVSFPCCCGYPIPKPGNYCEVNGTYYLPYQQYQLPGQCAEATCQPDGSIGAVGCPKIFVNESAGYALTDEDLSKPWPKCCPQPIFEGCYDGNHKYAPGESWQPKDQCARFTCIKYQNTSQAICPRILIPLQKGCHVVSDSDKPYPGCCPRPECPPTEAPTTETMPCFHKGRKYEMGDKVNVRGRCGYYECRGNNHWVEIKCKEVEVKKQQKWWERDNKDNRHQQRYHQDSDDGGHEQSIWQKWFKLH